MNQQKIVQLDGCSLTPEMLFNIGADHSFKLELTEESWEAVRKSRESVNALVKKGKPVYGVNTGFGEMSKVSIKEDQLAQLQLNLIRSHSCGVGEPLKIDQVRRLFALRLNALAKGYSGISPATLKHALQCFNLNLMPHVPSKGTLGMSFMDVFPGASGDLCPLSHLCLGLLGESKMYDPEDLPNFEDAAVLLRRYKLKKLVLQNKDGISMINGTQFITSIGIEALVRAQRLANQVDYICALSVEVLKGTPKAFHPFIHATRPHEGQFKSAQRIRSMMFDSDKRSKLAESHKDCGRVQDAYSLRCVPQVHGICYDTIKFVDGILSTEMNSATDNPMVFRPSGLFEKEISKIPDSFKSPLAKIMDSLVEKKTSDPLVICGGNFHGEYPAKALDYLSIAVHEIGSICERRIERLVNPALSGLPGFLTSNGGLNSGFMIMQYVAASLVSENKVLTHPSSADSIPSSGNKEDHVSMGGFAARKCLTIVDHVEKIFAIELLCACQALDLLKPLTTTNPLQAIYSLVRSKVKYVDADRTHAPDIKIVQKMIQESQVLKAVESAKK